jgi:hypothetical protein
VVSSSPQHGVEHHAEGAERLAAPLGAEAEEDDVARAVGDVEGGGAGVEEALAQQVARQER